MKTIFHISSQSDLDKIKSAQSLYTLNDLIIFVYNGYEFEWYYGSHTINVFMQITPKYRENLNCFTFGDFSQDHTSIQDILFKYFKGEWYQNEL